MTGKYKDQETAETFIDQFLASLGNYNREEISFADIIDVLRTRSFGLAALLFAVPMIIPMPPGIPMAAGAVLSVIGIQLMMGRERLWLPNWLMQKSVHRDTLAKTMQLSARYLGWLFRLARPRIPQLTGRTSRFIAGGIFLLMGILMILPIPVIGNIFPAFACIIIALALTDRDGVLFILGIGTTIIVATTTLYTGYKAWDLFRTLL